MTRFKLEDRVTVIDHHDEAFNENGQVINDWLGLGGDTVYVVLIDGRPEANTFLGQQLRREHACPDCGEAWDETMRPCPNCGLTIETVAQRIADTALTLNTEPLFASEAQETFTAGSRVYLTGDTPAVRAGAEGVYVGHLNERLAVINLDTPSGEPYRISVSFDLVRNLYR